MSDENEGTTEAVAEAQSAAPVAAAGTPPQADEVTTLRSRNAGLDAKVTELAKAAKAAQAAADAAAKRLADYEAGTVEASEALRAQIAAKDAELEAVRREATLAKVAAAYPEAYAELGDAAAALSADRLAAIEARLRGVAVESNTPPVPVGNNVARTTAPANKPIEEMSLAELKAYGDTAFNGLTWEAITVTGD